MYFIKMSNGVRTQCELASHAKEKFKKKIQKAVTRKKKPKANRCK